MKGWLLYLLFFILAVSASFKIHLAVSPEPIQEPECSIQNDIFYSGEELSYKISYNWGLIWLEVGKVDFKIEKEEYQGNPCYKITGLGNTYPSYDWIFKVRDHFECWVDTVTLKPYRYLRDIHEGGNDYFNECFFSFKKNKAFCVTRDNKKPPRLDTVAIHECTFDPLTMIYFSRNIDYSKYKPNDTIPISLFLDSKVYSLYIRYKGKEECKMEDKSFYNCIKFSPKLIEGTIFNSGEGMTVWGSDDKIKLPLLVEAPVLVGTVRASLTSWKGLKNPIEAKVR